MPVTINHTAPKRPILKKRLGQHILIDDNIKRKIIQSCDISAEEEILEIGSGYGALTKYLTDKAKRVIAVEIDKEMFQGLKYAFKDCQNIEIYCQDILKFNLCSFRNLKAIGNVPYYITSPIIEFLIKNRKYVTDIYLTVQKELAERVVAREGTKNFGSLSLFVQYFTQPQILFKISRNCFFPKPKVDSAFLRLKPIKRSQFHEAEEDVFFKIVRSCFSQRRKKLQNSLKKFFPVSIITDVYKRLKINSGTRPDQVGLNTYLILISSLLKLHNLNNPNGITFIKKI